MSKHLQIVLDDDEFGEIERIARRQATTVAEWVRKSLRRARQLDASATPEDKMNAIRVAAGYELPTADIEQLLGEIARGEKAIADGHLVSHAEAKSRMARWLE